MYFKIWFQSDENLIKLEDFEAFARTIGALVSSSDHTDIIQLALRFVLTNFLGQCDQKCKTRVNFCCELILINDIILYNTLKIAGKYVFSGASLCNEISAVDYDLYVC